MCSPPNAKKPFRLSLEDQFTFYISYHSEPVNKAIHLLCIWPILWTGFALAASAWSVGLPQQITEHLPLDPVAWNLNMATLPVLVYVLVYCVMDPVAGGLGALLVLACYASSNLWIAGGGSASLAGGVHVAGWVAQFYGHWVHEGRSPALMDNLFQALLAAPLFVLCEVLFYFGYRREMHDRIMSKAEKNIAEFRASKKQQQSKSS